jgi:hypothetical protein
MPSKNAVHQDKALENISIAYKPQGLIAAEFLPMVPVKHESDKYFVYAKDNLRIPNTVRADGAESNEVDWALSTASYQVEEHALRRLVTDRQRDNADAAIRVDADATEFLTGQILLDHEKELADLIGTAANWANTTSLTSTFAWSANTTLSNPISFADSASTVILQNSGYKPNDCVLDERTFKAAKEHISIVDRIKYTSPDSVTPQMLARLFNVERLMVASAVSNTGQEGLADSLGFLYTDMAFFCYNERNPGLMKPSAFYSFHKNGMGIDGGLVSVSRFREEKRKGDFVEVSRMWVHKPVATDCAYLIANTVQ